MQLESILEQSAARHPEKTAIICGDKRLTYGEFEQRAKQMGATAWVVQLGSFSSQENASNLNLKLREAGYPAFVEPLKRQGGMAYRVRVGPELLRSDAQKMKEKLASELKIDGIVIRYP